MQNLQPKARATDSFYFKMYLFYNLWLINSTSLFTATWNQLFLGLGANISGAPLADYTILSLFAHQVDGTIVTPRQINLWRLEGGKKIQPLLQTPKQQMYPVLLHKALLLSTSLCQYKVFRAHNNKKGFCILFFFERNEREASSDFTKKDHKYRNSTKIYLYECKWGRLVIILTYFLLALPLDIYIQNFRHPTSKGQRQTALVWIKACNYFFAWVTAAPE